MPGGTSGGRGKPTAADALRPGCACRLASQDGAEGIEQVARAALALGRVVVALVDPAGRLAPLPVRLCLRLNPVTEFLRLRAA